MPQVYHETLSGGSLWPELERSSGLHKCGSFLGKNEHRGLKLDQASAVAVGEMPCQGFDYNQNTIHKIVQEHASCLPAYSEHNYGRD